MRPVIKFFFVLLISLQAWQPLRAQVLKFERFTSVNGLLSDEVYNIYKDRKGYLWFFTNYGALRYNGFEFHPVLRNLSSRELFIYSFFEHKSGRKFFSTARSRLYEVVGDSAVPLKGTEEISKQLEKDVHEIFQVYADDSMNVYAVTKHGAYKFIQEGNGYRSVIINSYPSDSITFRVYEKEGATIGFLNYNGNDTVYCAGWENLKVKFYLKSDTFYHNLTCRTSVPRHWKTINNKVYLNHHDHLLEISADSVKEIALEGFITNFTMDDRGHLWVATYMNGLYEINNRDSIVNHYFYGITVNDVLYDPGTGLWASTTGYGLFHSSNIRHLYFASTHELSRPVNLIKKTKSHVLVCNSAGDIFRVPADAPDKPVKIYESRDGELLDMEDLGGDTLMLMFRYVLKSAVMREGRLLDKVIFKVLSGQNIIRDSHKMYITERKRAYTFSLKKDGTGTRRLWKTFDARLNKLYNHNNLCYAATDDGVIVLDTTGRELKRIKETGSQKISNIIKTPGGKLLFLSPGIGVFEYQSNREVVTLSEANGLPSNVIYNILFDSTDVLLATANGLYHGRGDLEQLQKIAWKKMYSGTVPHLSVAGNNVLIGTAGGLVLLDRSKESGPSLLQLYLTNVRTPSRSLTGTNSYTLSHFENSPEFNYDLVCYNNVSRVLGYELRGPYSDTGSVTGTVIKFSHLPPGKYQLRVFPILNTATKHVLVDFYIRPGLLQTPWFLVLSGLALAALLVTAFAVLLRYFRHKRERQIHAESKLLEYKLIALKAQINPHFMSNCLSAIQHLIISNRMEEAANYIAKFGFLVRKILHYSDKSWISLSEELSLARLYMDLEQLRFEKRFQYQLDIDEKLLEAKSIQIPALILNPIIENAIWHGLLPLKKSRSGLITIQATPDRGSEALILSITDNGVGRKPEKNNDDRESHGTRLIEDRLKNLNLLYGEDKCSISYEDVVENEIVCGTRVILTLPLNVKANVVS